MHRESMSLTCFYSFFRNKSVIKDCGISEF